jgi:hypothetical protein
MGGSGMWWNEGKIDFRNCLQLSTRPVEIGVSIIVNKALYNNYFVLL